MTQSEYERLVTQLALLMDAVDERLGKTIENIIVLMEARRNEIGNSAEENKTKVI